MQQVTDYDRFVRFSELKTMCGLSRATVWRLQKAGKFPKPKKIAGRAMAWALSDILAWIEQIKAEGKDV